MKKACFLDRDGVINKLVLRPDGKLTSPWRLSELSIFGEVHEAVFGLSQMGFKIFIVTNQPGVVRNELTLRGLYEINDYLKAELGHIDEIAVALTPGAYDYKPNPGMITNLIAKHGPFDMGHSYMIGDRWKDTAAGKAAGLITIQVSPTSYVEAPTTQNSIQPDHTTRGLLTAFTLIKRIEHGEEETDDGVR